MKNGILLAGGTGSRLYPLTHVVNKHLLGVDGKFIIDYPINTLKKMGCQNVTIILGGNHFSQVVDHLKDGSAHELNINYVYQGAPKGIAHAINLCKRFVQDDDNFSVILGDNIFEENINWNPTLTAQIVLHNHPELTRFGVASFNSNGQIVKIEEKPKKITPNLEQRAITGCYLFTQQFFEFFEKLQPSARGEYEITDIIRQYHLANNLSWTEIGGLWSDAGTHESVEYVNQYFYDKKRK